MCFVSTGPRSRQLDTPIHRASAHAENLGLRKLERITKKAPPDFLLATSLKLESTKMTQARDRGIPILLIEKLNQVRAAEGCLEAWLAADDCV